MDDLDRIMNAVLSLQDGLREANIMRGDEKIAVRLTAEVGERLEVMIRSSGRMPMSDRYGLMAPVADGAIASLMIADVEFQWPRPRYAKPGGGSTHYPSRQIYGPNGIIDDPGSNK